MHRPKHIVEYVVFRLLSFSVNLVPQSVALGLGSLASRCIFTCSPWRRRESARRIRQVMGTRLSEAEVRRISSLAFRDLVWHTIEILRTPKVDRKWVERNAVVNAEDRQRLDAALQLGSGVIIAVPHLANWDLAGIGLQQLGYPMTFIVRQQKNPLFDAYLNRMREHSGSDVIERDDPMLVRKVIRALKSGNVVAILVDLRARQSDLKIEFLGHRADLGRGVGLMSYLSACPVVPAFATRRDDGKHQWHFCDHIIPNRNRKRNEESERLLIEAVKPLETAIREHPEQYFWFNKRWVLEQIEPEGRGEPDLNLNSASD